MLLGLAAFTVASVAAAAGELAGRVTIDISYSSCVHKFTYRANENQFIEFDRVDNELEPCAVFKHVGLSGVAVALENFNNHLRIFHSENFPNFFVPGMTMGEANQFEVVGKNAFEFRRDLYGRPVANYYSHVNQNELADGQFSMMNNTNISFSSGTLEDLYKDPRTLSGKVLFFIPHEIQARFDRDLYGAIWNQIDAAISKAITNGYYFSHTIKIQRSKPDPKSFNGISFRGNREGIAMNVPGYSIHIESSLFKK